MRKIIVALIAISFPTLILISSVLLMGILLFISILNTTDLGTKIFVILFLLALSLFLLTILFNTTVRFLSVLYSRYTIVFTVDRKFQDVLKDILDKSEDEGIPLSINSGSISNLEEESAIEFVFESPTRKTLWGIFNGVIIGRYGNLSIIGIITSDAKAFNKILDLFEIQEHWKFSALKQLKFLFATQKEIFTHNIPLFKHIKSLLVLIIISYFMGIWLTLLFISLIFLSIVFRIALFVFANKETLKLKIREQ